MTALLFVLELEGYRLTFIGRFVYVIVLDMMKSEKIAIKKYLGAKPWCFGNEKQYVDFLCFM